MFPLKLNPCVPNHVSSTCTETTPAWSVGLTWLVLLRTCSRESARKRKMLTRFVCVSCGRREFPAAVSYRPWDRPPHSQTKSAHWCWGTRVSAVGKHEMTALPELNWQSVCAWLTWGWSAIVWRGRSVRRRLAGGGVGAGRGAAGAGVSSDHDMEGRRKSEQRQPHTHKRSNLTPGPQTRLSAARYVIHAAGPSAPRHRALS